MPRNVSANRQWNQQGRRPPDITSLPPSDSWWTDPGHFYTRAKQEADRMALSRFGGPHKPHNTDDQ